MTLNATEISPLDEDTFRCARMQAAALAKLPLFKSHEYEDLYQELILAVLSGSKAYDPERGPWHAYASSVMAYRATTLRLARAAQKRNPNLETVELDAWANPSAGTRCVDCLPSSNPSDDDPHLASRKIWLAQDLRLAMDTLPARHADICQRLMWGHSRARIASDLRCTLEHLASCLVHIRAAFRKKGLHHYIESPKAPQWKGGFHGD